MPTTLSIKISENIGPASNLHTLFLVKNMVCGWKACSLNLRTLCNQLIEISFQYFNDESLDSSYFFVRRASKIT